MLLDELFEAEENASIIVCGDFNAEPGEVPVEAIAGRVENTNNEELRGTALVSCSRSIPETIRFSHYHHGRGNLLDHMLMSQALLPHFQHAAIYNETLHDESLPFAFDRKYPESDHAPFVAEFDIGD
jgi:exonuclease III